MLVFPLTKYEFHLLLSVIYLLISRVNFFVDFTRVRAAEYSK